LAGSLADGFQIAVIEYRHAHGIERQVVDGLRHTFDAGGITSLAASLPIIATSRSLIHFAQVA